MSLTDWSAFTRGATILIPPASRTPDYNATMLTSGNGQRFDAIRMEALFEVKMGNGSMKAESLNGRGSIKTPDSQYVARYLEITNYLRIEAKKPIADGGGGMGDTRNKMVVKWLESKNWNRTGSASTSWTTKDNKGKRFKLMILKSELVPGK